VTYCFPQDRPSTAHSYCNLLCAFNSAVSCRKRTTANGPAAELLVAHWHPEACFSEIKSFWSAHVWRITVSSSHDSQPKLRVYAPKAPPPRFHCLQPMPMPSRHSRSTLGMNNRNLLRREMGVISSRSLLNLQMENLYDPTARRIHTGSCINYFDRNRG
jgi:hypothetical protein